MSSESLINPAPIPGDGGIWRRRLPRADARFQPTTFIRRLKEELGADRPTVFDSPSRLPKEIFHKLDSLAKERDPEFFFFALLHLGRELKRDLKDEAAVAIFQFLVKEEATSSELKNQALEESQAILGKGSFGRRVEYLGSRFVRDSANYKMIVPMFLGTAAFSFVRTTVMGRLASTVVPLGSRARLANLTAFGAELSSFALSSRLLHRMAGDPVRENLADDLLSTGITLGMLKISSWAGAHFNRAWVGRTPLFGSLVLQASTFLGLLSAHKMEEAIGLRPKMDEATTVTDTLAAMVSLGVGSHLGRRALGPGWARIQGQLDWQYQLSKSTRSGTEKPGWTAALLSTGSQTRTENRKGKDRERTIAETRGGSATSDRFKQPPPHRPTLYGIAHDGSPKEMAWVENLLREAYKGGARSVGLEISEGLLNNPTRFNIFKRYGLYAQEIGMRIIALESDAGLTRRTILNRAKFFIGKDGEFDRNALELVISKIDYELERLERNATSSYSPPEFATHLAVRREEKRRFEFIRETLKGIDYDLDRYAALWREANETQVDLEMFRSIEKERPDLAIMGLVHAKALIDCPGYLMVDATGDSSDREGIFPPPSLEKEILSLIDRPNISQGKYLSILQEALSQEPDLPRLILRAFSDTNRKLLEDLVPGKDIQFLKMSTTEARSKLKKALDSPLHPAKGHSAIKRAPQTPVSKAGGNSDPGSFHAVVGPVIPVLETFFNGQPSLLGTLLGGLMMVAGSGMVAGVFRKSPKSELAGYRQYPDRIWDMATQLGQFSPPFILGAQWLLHGRLTGTAILVAVGVAFLSAFLSRGGANTGLLELLWLRWTYNMTHAGRLHSGYRWPSWIHEKLVREEMKWLGKRRRKAAWSQVKSYMKRAKNWPSPEYYFLWFKKDPSPAELEAEMFLSFGDDYKKKFEFIKKHRIAAGKEFLRDLVETELLCPHPDSTDLLDAIELLVELSERNETHPFHPKMIPVLQDLALSEFQELSLRAKEILELINTNWEHLFERTPGSSPYRGRVAVKKIPSAGEIDLKRAEEEALALEEQEAEDELQRKAQVKKKKPPNNGPQNLHSLAGPALLGVDAFLHQGQLTPAGVLLSALVTGMGVLAMAISKHRGDSEGVGRSESETFQEFGDMMDQFLDESFVADEKIYRKMRRNLERILTATDKTRPKYVQSLWDIIHKYLNPSFRMKAVQEFAITLGSAAFFEEAEQLILLAKVLTKEVAPNDPTRWELHEIETRIWLADFAFEQEKTKDIANPLYHLSLLEEGFQYVALSKFLQRLARNNQLHRVGPLFEKFARGVDPEAIAPAEIDKIRDLLFDMLSAFTYWKPGGGGFGGWGSSGTAMVAVGAGLATLLGATVTHAAEKAVASTGFDVFISALTAFAFGGIFSRISGWLRSRRGRPKDSPSSLQAYRNFAEAQGWDFSLVMGRALRKASVPEIRDFLKSQFPQNPISQLAWLGNYRIEAARDILADPEAFVAKATKEKKYSTQEQLKIRAKAAEVLYGLGEKKKIMQYLNQVFSDLSGDLSWHELFPSLGGQFTVDPWLREVFYRLMSRDIYPYVLGGLDPGGKISMQLILEYHQKKKKFLPEEAAALQKDFRQGWIPLLFADLLDDSDRKKLVESLVEFHGKQKVVSELHVALQHRETAWRAARFLDELDPEWDRPLRALQAPRPPSP